MTRAPTQRKLPTTHAPANAASLEEVPVLAVAGDFAQRITVVPTSMTSMLLSTGYLQSERRHVLLPCVEIKIAGVEQSQLSEELSENEYQEIFSYVLPLENALFMTYDLVRDIRIACTRLKSLSSGGLALEPARLRHAKDFADKMQRQAEQCSAILDELIAGATTFSRSGSSSTADSDESEQVSPKPRPRLRKSKATAA